MKKKILTTLTLLLFKSSLFGQFNFEYTNSIPCIKGIDTLNLAWSGGLNYAQFSDLDIDFDGDLDLFVFDRSSDNIRVFLQTNTGGNPRYTPYFQSHLLFPNDIRYRATTIDYDHDGRNDLFTYGIGGMKVYRNIGDNINGPQWETAKELLYSDYSGSYMNLYISSSDIPALVDVENDGDIDILTFSISGEHLEYHQNQSMENYGIPDSLEFILKNKCWGLFSEDINTNSLILNDQSTPCTTGNITEAESPLVTNQEPDKDLKKPIHEAKHSGSTVLAIDIDSSGVLDLIIGDVSYPNLNMLINSGDTPNTNSPIVSIDYSFPSNSLPANLQLFPAAYWLDIDFDNKKDLIVSANAKNISENIHSILMYKNTGTNGNPTFVYQTNSFLQNEMIEHGSGSIPIFFDYNQDGLEDLFVANLFRYKPTLSKESSIAYYQNTGTSTLPEFSFVDDDFLNLSTQSLGLRMIPTFGDLDNDGDKDMLLGLENGTLRYFQNNNIGTSPSFTQSPSALVDFEGNIISLGQFVSPQLFDLNQDGVLDLIIGKKTGELSYYQNIGTVNTPIFKLINDTLGNVDLSTNSPDGYATPHFFMNHDTIFLFLGGIDGQLHAYKAIENNLTPGSSFELISDQLLTIHTGAYSAFWVNNIDNDTLLDLFVGQDLGGLNHLEVNPNGNSGILSLNPALSINIYPNPSQGTFNVSTEETDNIHYDVIDLYGKIVSESNIIQGKNIINLKEVNPGIYIIKFENSYGNQLVKRIVVY